MNACIAIRLIIMKTSGWVEPLYNCLVQSRIPSLLLQMTFQYDFGSFRVSCSPLWGGVFTSVVSPNVKECGIQQICGFGIESGIQSLKSRIHGMESTIHRFGWNPGSISVEPLQSTTQDLGSTILDPESMFWDLESEASWLPLRRVNCGYLWLFWDVLPIDLQNNW